MVRWLTRLLLLALSVAVSGLASSCGSGVTSLAVALAPTDSTNPPVKPGDIETLTVTVTNRSAQDARGVTAHVDLPGGFRYKDTTSITSDGVRTQPIDAQVNSQAPVWGIWNLSGVGTSVSITFEAIADGLPKSYDIVARAAGDTSSGDTLSKPVSVKLEAAPKLSMSVTASPTSVRPGQDLTYTVSVTNDGTGSASGIAILVSLPPIFAFDFSRTPFKGNYSRSGGTDPVKGAAVVYYDGFALPARSDSGPGLLDLSFEVAVLRNAGAPGTYVVGVQLIDDPGTLRLNINSGAPVRVTAE